MAESGFESIDKTEVPVNVHNEENPYQQIENYMDNNVQDEYIDSKVTNYDNGDNEAGKDDVVAALIYESSDSGESQEEAKTGEG